MSQPPLVSVVIATYNRSNALAYAISSVLSQTFTDFEVLVVGDGCTDDSQAVVEGFDDPRVKWIGLDHNHGHQAEPNNIGISNARGKYIAYLGHDDLWFPHHLQSSVDALETGFDLSYTLTLSIAEKEGLHHLLPISVSYITGMWIPPSSVLHRRSLIDDIGAWRLHRELKQSPDSELIQRAADAGKKFVNVPRLSALKIPAACRRNVYKLRSCDEQHYWYDRISSEPELEAVELAKCYIELSQIDSNGEKLKSLALQFKRRRYQSFFKLRLLNKLSKIFGRPLNLIEQSQIYKDLNPRQSSKRE
ncbi:hypothetical protein BOW53_13380 [Solemya pervernicosa gill symbiont]|uniref:Glycosyltransferase 2-like domain-containing protein n=2 Tax=Gammaproteobacteria incertae sedis TaxID=118884 RepID=A0A1T2L1K0_9GAMM|nr:glycosyltransferase [Candidatus Reidiella endopervernicosa]OOZ38988.1 hypothetical protein BOW53_13380 [Solemya pervernicosa gill symbiont]QKQ25478.1 glycosyltransferase [Candidatus Reidiella endopervernicosa]